MDTINELSPAERHEAARAIIRQSLDEMATEFGAALRDAALVYPVFVTVPHSGDALATIASPVDPPNDDWEKIVEIFTKIIGDHLGCDGLRSRNLPCKAVNVAMSGADITVD